VEAPGEEEEARRDAPEKAPGLATGLANTWRRRTGARRQITQLVARWHGSSAAGEQRAHGGEQRNVWLHSMVKSRAAAKEKFPPRRCFARIRPRGGARGGDTAWPARGGGTAACGGGTTVWPRVVSAVTRQPARSVRRLVPLTCGPSGLFEFLMIFNHSNFEIQNSDLPDVQNSPNFS
jgi:hypothetical protein